MLGLTQKLLNNNIQNKVNKSKNKSMPLDSTLNIPQYYREFITFESENIIKLIKLKIKRTSLYRFNVSYNI